MKIIAAKYIRGTLELPGDKSISHRAAILSAMAQGNTQVQNFAASADCASTLKCLEALGVEINRDDSTVVIKGVGKQGLRKPETALDCGNSGTTMRLLTGVLAGQNFDSVLVGDESLQKRPMKRVIDPLRLMGAEIDAEGNNAPLRIFGKKPLR
ncbi:MAG: 3-phosphoshikimate 1-carboxyvinyltransferase, partial [Blastocatellia bacterium]|nr:3-phosphoshikimate 1-carboxyvinyltransferase [Blastocatellia bacterium]